MVWQLIPSTRSGCTKAGQMEAVPQSTFSGVSVLTHSSACSFLPDCSGTALTPPVSCFFPAASLVVFQELSCCPHVSPPPLGRCIFYRSNRLLRCCPFDLMRENSYNNDVHHYWAGDLVIHISPRILILLFLWVLLPALSAEQAFFSQPYICIFCCFSPCSPESPHTFPALSCLLLLLFSKGKPFTLSEGSNDLSLTSQMLTKFLIIVCLSTAGVQHGVSDFRHKSLAFSQAGWTPGSRLKHHRHWSIFSAIPALMSSLWLSFILQGYQVSFSFLLTIILCLNHGFQDGF